MSSEALALAQAGQLDNAVPLWCEAVGLAACLASGDPRQAASNHNLAAGLALAGDWPAAAGGFAQAVEAWTAARQWVLSTSVEARARSSLFHFRMEQECRAALDAHTQRRCAEWASIGHAVSSFGLGLARLCSGAAGLADGQLENALEQMAAWLGSGHQLLCQLQQVMSATRSGTPAMTVHGEIFRGLRLLASTGDSQSSPQRAMWEAIGLLAILGLKGEKMEPADPRESAG